MYTLIIMKSQTNLALNWTKNYKIKTKIVYPSRISHIKKIISNKEFISAGNQRSYGDVAINKKLILSMRNFNRIIYFNRKSGIIEIQSGALLIDVLNHITNESWFFPVTPGSKHVSIGGMIANNIHGKNTHKNQMKHFVTEMKILLANNKIIECSRSKNKKVFDLTIGGFGLTGVILSAKIKLKKIKSVFINQTVEKFYTYREFFSQIKKAKKFEYHVTWVDTFDSKRIKGLSYFGLHSNDKNLKKFFFKDGNLGFIKFFFLKIFTQNYYGIKVLNFFYRLSKAYFFKKQTDMNSFFYPQDKFLDWNKLFGKKGFFECQFLVKEKYFKATMGEISDYFIENKIFSTLIVIKSFNERGEYLNFCGKGISISMDIPINNKYLDLVAFLNKLIIKYNAKLNLAKDSIAKRGIFKDNLRYRKFKRDLVFFNKKNKIKSVFSERLDI